MNLIPWKKHRPAPVSASPILALQREMNRMFNQFFGDAMPGFATFEGFPAVSVRADAATVTVTAEVPGLTPQDLDIAVDGGVLTLRGHKQAEKETKDDEERWHRVERSYGSFVRRVELPSAVDSERAEASLDRGVLTLKLPKLAAEKGKAIQIQAK